MTNSMNDLVDDALAVSSAGKEGKILAYKDDMHRFPQSENGTITEKNKLSKMFTSPTGTPSKLEWRPVKNFAIDKGQAVTVDPLSKSSFASGIIPVKFKKDNDYGFIITKRGSAQNETIKDDEAYVPLSFTDLRPINGSNSYRTVYFRPFITNLSEDLTPEWNKQAYFGRVDPVATYQSTTRTISLGFQIVAFGPEDVKVIYQKLHWLASMVYPEYDADLAYKSGPVVRMRIGDVISAAGPEGNMGLPGIIESLAFDYTDSVWELKKGIKVPRNINVSLSFHVLHDMPIGRGVDGKFGGIGSFNKDSGVYVPIQPGSENQKSPAVDESHNGKFRAVTNMDYTTLDINSETK